MGYEPLKPSQTLHPSEQILLGKKVLIIVENLPVPFDRRVWQEARALRDAGAEISIVCPTGKSSKEKYEYLEGIHIYRHDLPLEANGALGYVVEYSSALFWQSFLAWKIFLSRGFDIIHGCNPPDLVFAVALQFRLFGKRYIFDHHDISPELYEAKYGRRGAFWNLLRFIEWLNFKFSDVVISTNNSYKEIATSRGGKRGDDVFIVRSGPDLSRVREVAKNPDLKNGREFLVGYVGVMGEQEGIDLLLQSVQHLIYNRGRTDIQFILVGGGAHLEKLKALCEALALNDYVTFTGRAPDDLLFQALSTADVCVNPDRVNPMNDKSTMNKILEYMALGKPIVQFDVTEGRYSAQSASLYALKNDPVDFASKIEDLLADAELRRTMGNFGRKRVESSMAWSYEIPSLLAAYRRAFAK